MVAVKTGFPSPPMPGMPAPMQPMGGLPPMPPMGGPGSFPQPMGGGNPFAPMPPMPLAGMPPPPMQPPMARPPMPQQQQQGSNAPRRRRFGDSLENMLGRNQGLGAPTPQQRPLPMPPQMMPQQRMVAPGVPMMATPTPRPMEMGGEVDIFGYEDGGPVQYFDAGGAAHAHPHSGGGVDADIANAYITNMVAGRDDLSAADKLEFANQLAESFGVQGGSGVQSAIDNLAGQQVAPIIDETLSMVYRYGDVNASNDVAPEVEVHAGTSAENTFADGSYFDSASNTYIKPDGSVISPTVTDDGLGINHTGYMDDDDLVTLGGMQTYNDADTVAAVVDQLSNSDSLDNFLEVNTAAGTDLTSVNNAIAAMNTSNTSTDTTNTNNTGTDDVLNINMGNMAGSTSTALPPTLDNTALFGVSTNVPAQTVSQYVQDPNTFQMTATPSPYMTAASPMGSISLPARPMDINIGNYLSDPAYGSIKPYTETPASCAAKGMQYDPVSKLCVPVTGSVGMKMGGIVQGFDMGGHAHPHSSNSSIGPSGYTSLDAIANQAVQDDDDKSFKYMGQSYNNVSDYHDAIFGDDDDDNQTQNTSPNAGDGGGSTTSTGSGSAGSLGGGSTGGGSTGGGSTPVVYRDIYGRRYGSQAEADAANRMIAQQQSDTPDRTIDKEIAGPDLAYDDALALTQGVLPPQFSGAVPPGSQFSYGNIGGIGDTASGFNLPPAVVDPGVGGTAQTLGLGLDTQDPDSISNIINLDAPSGGTGTTTTTFPTGGPGTFGSTGLPAAPVPTTEDQYLNASGVTANTTYPSGGTSTTSGIQPASSTTAQNLNQGIGNLKPKPRPTTGNQDANNTNTGNQNTGGGDPGYRPPPNAAETEYLQNLLGQFEFDDEGKMVFAEPGTVEKVLNQIVSNLSLGFIDMEDLDNEKVQAVLDAYYDTGKFAYDSESGASLDLSETLLGPDGKLDPDKLKAFDEKIKIFQGDGIEPAVTGVYDSEGNIVSYGPDIKNTKDGPVLVDDVDIFGGGSNGGGDNDSDTTTDGPDTGHTVDDNGNKVCNTEGYVYNPETKICEPAKVTETSDDVGINIGSGTSGMSFDDVLANVVIPAPNVAPISANIQPMKMGGMAGLNRAADNFIKALAG